MTQYVGVTVDRDTNDPQPWSGTDLGVGKMAGNVMLYVNDGDGNPIPMDIADFQAVPTPTTVTAFTVSVTSTPAGLASHPCKAVTIQNDPDSTVDLFVGDASSQPFQLLPGQSLSIDISNTSALWGKTASGTATLNALALS